MSELWRINSALSNAPHTEYSLPCLGAGIQAGLLFTDTSSVKRKLSVKNGVARTDSSSYKPEIDMALLAKSCGKAKSYARQSQANSMVAKCPPAECPTKVMRLGSPPNRCTLRYTQATALTICIVMCEIVTAGHKA